MYEPPVNGTLEAMDPLLNYYNAHLDRYGADDPRGLGWRDDHSQLSRFKVLAEVADLSGASVLDEGCGFGDLYAFLAARYPDIRYTGIDINPRAIAEAQKKYPAAHFEAMDFSQYQGEPVDYALASGTFTFRIPDYQDVYFAQIAKLFQLARKGVAFNMIDAKCHSGDETYVTYSIPEVYDFCSQLTDKFQIRHDYSEEDFTFYLYH